jgi:gliding motility-associated-like protein
MKIFSRLGEQVAELNQLTSTWDGTQNGNFLPPGLYIYTIRAIIENGQIYTKTGSIEIIK